MTWLNKILKEEYKNNVFKQQRTIKKWNNSTCTVISRRDKKFKLEKIILLGLHKTWQIFLNLI